MNQFPFKSEKYRQYQNTFLQDVTVGFDFPVSQVEKSELNALFNDYVQSFFGVTSDGDITTGMCNITRKDMLQSFDFSNRSAVIHLSGKNYATFSDTAIPPIFKLRNFFNKVVQTSKLSKTGIRKLNVFNIKTDDKTAVDAAPIMRALFSEDLMASLSAENLDQEEQAVPGLMKCSFQAGDDIITIRTVLLPPSQHKDAFHHLLLDTLGEINPANGIKVDEVADLLMDFNKSLYDCFHWCVSNRVKQVMLQDNQPKQGKE